MMMERKAWEAQEAIILPEAGQEGMAPDSSRRSARVQHQQVAFLAALPDLVLKILSCRRLRACQ